jgi:hypothetical protein
MDGRIIGDQQCGFWHYIYCSCNWHNRMQGTDFVTDVNKTYDSIRRSTAVRYPFSEMLGFERVSDFGILVLYTFIMHTNL